MMKPIKRARDENYTNKPHKEPPIDFNVNERMKIWAAEKVPGVDIEWHTEKMMNCRFRVGRKDWTAVWRNWMMTEQEKINIRQSNRDFYAGKLEKPKTIEQTRARIDQIAEDCGLPPGTDTERVLAANKRRIEGLLN